MRRSIIFAIALVAACHTPANQPSIGTSDYKVPDDSAITKAVHDAYAVISFQPGAKPAYDSIKYCFVPQAQLINFRGDTAQTTGIDQFVDAYKQFMEGNHIVLFAEEEIAGRTEQFGRIAHRISTYQTHVNSMDSLPERGVNSFQLIKTPAGWKVSSIIWDVERPSLPIPHYYLRDTD
jgi:hypothetical protein